MELTNYKSHAFISSKEIVLGFGNNQLKIYKFDGEDLYFLRYVQLGWCQPEMIWACGNQRKFIVYSSDGKMKFYKYDSCNVEKENSMYMGSAPQLIIQAANN